MRRNKCWGESLDVLFYDCTTLYFESLVPDELIWQVNHVVATLVFQHRPEQRDLTEVFQKYFQSIVWNVEILNLLPPTFYQ